MQLSTFLFLVFLALVFLIQQCFPKKLRWIWLLAASYAFCAFADYRFALVLLGVTLAAYFMGLLIARAGARMYKRVFLWTGILVSLGVLFSFKYLNFSLNVLEDLLKLLGAPRDLPVYQWLMPLGLSFYTFQVISYLVDVYNGVIQPERNAGKFALYLAFFPKLISGPIERADHLLPQITRPNPFDYQKFVAALLRIFWGFFKKLVIADRLAVLVGTVFGSPAEYYAPQTLLAVLTFSLQIYIDFSAYCDIALGAASLLGIDLVENFNLPYLARTVTEFWRRWHISLSNWLRDYLFIPLNFATRRKKTSIWLPVNILIVFLVSGVWHGANYTFLIWGLLHGLYQAVEAVTLKWRTRLEKRFSSGTKGFLFVAFQVVLTFAMVCLAWIFFRAESVQAAGLMLKNILTLRGSLHAVAWDFSQLGLTPADFWILGAAFAVFCAFELAGTKGSLFIRSQSWALPLRWSVYLLLIFSVILFGYFGTFKASDFIYAGF